MENTPDAQVIAHEKKLLEAMKTSNVELLDELLYEYLLFNGPTGETATKAMDLSNYEAGNVHLHTLEPSDMKLSIINDTVVVAVTIWMVGNYTGHEINGQFRYLRVWKQFEDSWKVIAGSVIPLNPAS